MEKGFKERVAHVLNAIEDEISSINKDTFPFITVTTSSKIVARIEVLDEILDRDSEEFETLLSIKEKLMEKHKELGIVTVDKVLSTIN